MSQNTIITKSDYLAYLDAPRHLWAAKHTVEQLPLDPLAQHQMEDGKRVEKLAYDYLAEWVKSRPACRLLYQQSFSDGPYNARVDFLIHDTQADTYELIEVKSSTEVKKDHIPDLAFQLAILQNQVQISKCIVMHLNKDYRRHGNLEISELFTLSDVTDEVRNAVLDVILLRPEALRAAQLEDYSEAAHCLKPRDCPYPNLCHADLPEQSIYDVPYLMARKKQALLDIGALSIHDIPSDFALSESQRRVVDCAQQNRVHIDHAQLKHAIDGLEYPFWFLDYESCISAIPLFDGHWPQQQILFQYSLHKIASPGADLEHFAFLSFEPGNPIPALMVSLRENLGDEGSIIVWNKNFETTRHKELMELYPEHSAYLDNINNRIFDLMDIVSKHMYYDPRFNGRYGLKYVLPVLVPELSYEDLPINIGTKASVAWWQMNAGLISDDALTEVRQNMLDYCHLDTLAMVRLLAFFQSLLE